MNFLVTVTETYRVEADSEDEALDQVAAMRGGVSNADTEDMQAEEVR